MALLLAPVPGVKGLRLAGRQGSNTMAPGGLKASKKHIVVTSAEHFFHAGAERQEGKGPMKSRKQENEKTTFELFFR